MATDGYRYVAHAMGSQIATEVTGGPRTQSQWVGHASDGWTAHPWSAVAQVSTRHRCAPPYRVAPFMHAHTSSCGAGAPSARMHAAHMAQAQAAGTRQRRRCGSEGHPRRWAAWPHRPLPALGRRRARLTGDLDRALPQPGKGQDANPSSFPPTISCSSPHLGC